MLFCFPLEEDTLNYSAVSALRPLVPNGSLMRCEPVLWHTMIPDLWFRWVLYTASFIRVTTFLPSHGDWRLGHKLCSVICCGWFHFGRCPKEQVTGQTKFPSEQKAVQGQAPSVVSGCPIRNEVGQYCITVPFRRRSMAVLMQRATMSAD